MPLKDGHIGNGLNRTRPDKDKQGLGQFVVIVHIGTQDIELPSRCYRLGGCARAFGGQHPMEFRRQAEPTLDRCSRQHTGPCEADFRSFLKQLLQPFGIRRFADTQRVEDKLQRVDKAARNAHQDGVRAFAMRMAASEQIQQGHRKLRGGNKVVVAARMVHEAHKTLQLPLAAAFQFAKAHPFQRLVKLVQRVKNMIRTPTGQKRRRAHSVFIAVLTQNSLDRSKLFVKVQFLSAICGGSLG